MLFFNLGIPVIHYLVLTSSLEKPNQAFVLFLFNQIIPILGRPIFLAFTKLTYRVLYLCRRESLKTSESMDSLKFLVHLWIH